MNGVPWDGIWDDGEWVSWDSINQALDEEELQREFPGADLAVVEIFQDLISLAANYKTHTGRYLGIWGELGELYAELKFGVKRHRPGTPGSDGRIGNDWVEIKTISPMKNAKPVLVKRAGNFNKVILVKISPEFEFDARILERRLLGKGAGKYIRARWPVRD